MHISVEWLNSLLSPGTPPAAPAAPLSAQEIEHALTFAGFPIESATPVAGGAGGKEGDICLDVEVTSNRGDVLSHLGVAREVAAATRRAVKPISGAKTSQSDRAGRDIDKSVELVNRCATPVAGSATPGAGDVECPLFSIRVIRGVKVGPSPAWLVKRLEAVGQRSINNVVDVTNYIAFELGQPTHVFDLGKLRQVSGKARVIVRRAIKGEKLPLLDGKTITLAGDEVVVADGHLPGIGSPEDGAAISLAGVMGGGTTEVSNSTVDVLFEAATWSPVAVRRTARRFGIRTDASHRFERIVDPRTIDAAAQRACDLMLEVAGGRLESGVISHGAPPKPLARIRLRPARCTAILGVVVPESEIRRILAALEIEVTSAGTSAATGEFECVIPAHRPDLEREIDLIEEVARIHGLDKLPLHDRVAVKVDAPQARERAVKALTGVLTGQGFDETVTFTFIPPKLAKPFMPIGLASVEVCDERRKADPVLRPSILPSLLACRRANQDSGGDKERSGAASGSPAGDSGVRLFEISSTFAQTTPPPHPSEPGANANGAAPHKPSDSRGQAVERVSVALLADVCFPAGAKTFDQKQAAVRLIRGVIENLCQTLGGADLRVRFVDPPGGFPVEAYDAAARAGVVVERPGSAPVVLGLMGLCSPSVQSQFGLETPVVMAELGLQELLGLFPPRSVVHELPAFPSIERDLSLIVREDVTWERIESLVNTLKVERLEHASFVTTYRGQQAGPGRKSVTLRMRFRDPARTLRHEEVDGSVNAVVDAAKAQLGAELRVV
ncbi:MAG TPA: phenylalanine--tRNA ligase subunit beta [Phycisphaerales bacterium]|nr:phenylalanine--tRNA ligase subunit beta [Phycisphaerales bacterium]